jgi:hypothetical protein
MIRNNQNFPSWIIPFLKFSGFYNLAWGVFIFNQPYIFYKSLNDNFVHVPWFIPYLGFLVGGLGLCYLWAASNPLRYVGFIALGVLSKAGGVLGGDYFLLLGENPKWNNFTLHLIFNDLLWVIPFSLALYAVLKVRKGADIST